MIYYSSHSPSSLITESLSVTQSLLHTRRVSRITVKALVIYQYYSISLPCRQGAVEGTVWIRTVNELFFRSRNRQKLVQIKFENIRYTFRPFFLGHHRVDCLSYSRQLYNMQYYVLVSNKSRFHR